MSNDSSPPALITGITGQVGSYLAELLLERGYEVHGIIRRASTFNTGRINHIYENPQNTSRRLMLHYGDLSDGSGLTNLVLRIEPDEIYKLGAQSHVRVSFDQPLYTVDVVASGTMRMLEAARQLQRRKEVLAAHDERRPYVEVWGTGSASREFLFVQDAARAIALATESYNESQPINVGSGAEITIRRLTELICELCGFDGVIRWDSSRPDGQPRRCLDTTRAREILGFAAETDLREGLIQTIEWYKEHRQIADANI